MFGMIILFWKFIIKGLTLKHGNCAYTVKNRFGIFRI